MSPTLYLLIGPKGSGKTYIGSVVERRTDICFLRVEPIWLGLQPGQDGWMEVERAVDAMFENHERVMIESLGAGERFPGFLSSLQSKYSVKLIRVLADSDTCLERVRTRNRAEHVAVSDEQVAEYNRIAERVQYDWDAVIDNNGPASEDAIVVAVLAIM